MSLPPIGEPSKRIEGSGFQPLQQSPLAFQKESRGGLLSAIGGWSLFPPRPYRAEVFFANRTRTKLVSSNFAFTQKLLVGRLSKETSNDLYDWMRGNASNRQLKTFAKFLKEADRLESLKPENFYLTPSKETDRCVALSGELIRETIDDFPLMMKLVKEIEYSVTVNNTQVIGDAMNKPLAPGGRSLPYLRSLQRAEFSLLHEIRPPKGMIREEVPIEMIHINITDPRTKETRSLKKQLPFTEEKEIELLRNYLVFPSDFDLIYEKVNLPKQNKKALFEECQQFAKKAQEVLAIRIYDLKTNIYSRHLANFYEEKGKGSIEMTIEMMKQGNLYTISENESTYLSLVPPFLEHPPALNPTIPHFLLYTAKAVLQTEEGKGVIPLPIIDANNINHEQHHHLENAQNLQYTSSEGRQLKVEDFHSIKFIMYSLANHSIGQYHF